MNGTVPSVTNSPTEIVWPAVIEYYGSDKLILVPNQKAWV